MSVRGLTVHLKCNVVLNGAPVLESMGGGGMKHNPRNHIKIILKQNSKTVQQATRTKTANPLFEELYWLPPSRYRGAEAPAIVACHDND